MTHRKNRFAAALAPLLASLTLTACGNDSAGSDALPAENGSGGAASPGAGGAGVGAPTGGMTTPPPGTTGGPSTAGPTGPTGPAMSTGPSGPATSEPVPTGSTPVATPGTGGMPAAAGGTPGVAGASPGTGGTPPGPVGSGGTPPASGGGGNGAGGAGTPVDGVNVQLNAVRQPIRGFGINTALMPGGSLPYDDLFTTEGPNGIGMSILRVGMNSNGTLTGQGISEARQRGAIVIGSTWSPPANCKSNNSTQNGGNLLESCYDSWATTIANFARDQDLYAMSIANESDFASCPGTPVCTVAYDTTVYTAKQMVAWVKVAGAKIREVAPDTLVIAPEASEWVHVWGNASGTGSIVSSHPHSSDPLDCGCYANAIDPAVEATCAQHCIDGDGYDYGHWLWADQDAWNSFDILGVHEYDSQIAFAWPEDVNGGVRDKEVWQTEMSGVRHWPEEGPSIDINNGVAVAGWIHSAMTVGEASAWLYWWYEAYYEDDNEGLALIKNNSTIAKRYFTFGNYSKFVRPGYNAVDVVGDDDANVLISAYAGEGGEVVVVAINKGDAAAEFPITITGGTAPASMTPHVTSASQNLVAGTAVTVTDGVFTASLPAKTVTSFVSQ